MLSIRTEVRALSELRCRIEGASEEEWQKICSSLIGAAPNIIKENLDIHRSKFAKITEYNNEALRTTFMPAYRRMLTVFRERLWLAEPDARQYLGQLVEYVDIWERFLSESIPGEVIQAIGHSEEKLLPFYQYVEQTVDQLRTELSEP